MVGTHGCLLDCIRGRVVGNTRRNVRWDFGEAPKSAREARALPKLRDALALQPYNAMISRHDDSNCPLLRFVRFDFRDFNFIGTRSSVAVCDIESFCLTDDP